MLHLFRYGLTGLHPYILAIGSEGENSVLLICYIFFSKKSITILHLFGVWPYIHIYWQMDPKGKTLYYVSVIIPSPEKKEIITNHSITFSDFVRACEYVCISGWQLPVLKHGICGLKQEV
jgi:hypothetical protein